MFRHMTTFLQTVFLGTIVGAGLTTVVVALTASLTDPGRPKNRGLHKHKL